MIAINGLFLLVLNLVDLISEQLTDLTLNLILISDLRGVVNDIFLNLVTYIHVFKNGNTEGILHLYSQILIETTNSDVIFLITWKGSIEVNHVVIITLGNINQSNWLIL